MKNSTVKFDFFVNIVDVNCVIDGNFAAYTHLRHCFASFFFILKKLIDVNDKLIEFISFLVSADLDSFMGWDSEASPLVKKH